MGRYLVPAAMVFAVVALAVASLTVGGVPEHPTWWRAAVQLAVLGGIVPMIYAVNVRIVPVFARRQWRSAPLVRAQIAVAIAGAWLTFGGRLADARPAVIGGLAVALLSALLFTVNLMLLFRQPTGPMPALPLPYSDQARVDRIATAFTRLSGLYLLIGLGVGLATEIWPPRTGRWDLVWAHAMLIGFFLSMASGVSYHVLARWTTRRWRSVAAIRVHFLAVAFGLPLMLAALATNASALFYGAGLLQALALFLFLANIGPMVLGLPSLSRFAWLAAGVCLTTGVFLGASFAAHPELGVRLRMAHAEVNLFGWTGLLISGAGYYLIPRFAGNPLRWPRLAPVQLAMLCSGIIAGATALGARGYGRDTDAAILGAQVLTAAAFLLLAGIAAGTFLNKAGSSVKLITPSRERYRPSWRSPVP